MDKFIEKITLLKAIVASVLLAILFMIINFSGIGVAGLVKITGGPSILDFNVGFTLEQAYEMLSNLGSIGRSFYLTKILPIDFIFPFAYMLCFTSWIALLGKQKISKYVIKILLIIPIIAMLCDWIENIGIIIMICKYPILPTWTATLSSIMGIVKMASIVGSIVVMTLLFILIFIKKRERV